MPNWERFRNAPIAEAILDIAVQYPVPVELGRLEAFHDQISERYPVKRNRVAWQGQIQVEEERIAHEVRRGAQGFMFRSADDTQVVQVRQDGFTFNWLKRYDSWEALRNAARPHWERYRETFHPEAVTRLGLRYLNRIELPLPLPDFREYILTAPEIAPGLPQGLSALFLRLEIPDMTRGLIAIITETIQAPVDEGKRLPFIFDIDIVCGATFEPSSPAIWEKFAQMRDYKNEIFFASMTERAKEMFR
jgi:uncharacterized protein (TIGR04255 family)